MYEPDNYITLNTAFQATTAAGKQLIWAAFNPNNAAESLSTFWSGAMHDPATICDIAANAAGAASANANKNIRVIIRNWHQSYRFKNPTNVDVYLTEYRCVAKKDIPAAVGKLGTDIFTNSESLATAIAAPFATKIDPTVYGSTPFQSSMFTRWFKIKKFKQHMLRPGMTKDLRYVYKKPRRFAISDFTGTTSATAAPSTQIMIKMKKGTSFSVFRLQGGIGDVSTGNAPSACAVEVDCIGVTRITFAYFGYSDTVQTGVNVAMPSSFADGPYVMTAANPAVRVAYSEA